MGRVRVPVTTTTSSTAHVPDNMDYSRARSIIIKLLGTGVVSGYDIIPMSPASSKFKLTIGVALDKDGTIIDSKHFRRAALCHRWYRDDPSKNYAVINTDDIGVTNGFIYVYVRGKLVDGVKEHEGPEIVLLTEKLTTDTQSREEIYLGSLTITDGKVTATDMSEKEIAPDSDTILRDVQELSTRLDDVIVNIELNFAQSIANAVALLRDEIAQGDNNVLAILDQYVDDLTEAINNAASADDVEEIKTTMIPAIYDYINNQIAGVLNITTDLSSLVNDLHDMALQNANYINRIRAELSNIRTDISSLYFQSNDNASRISALESNLSSLTAIVDTKADQLTVDALVSRLSALQDDVINYVNDLTNIDDRLQRQIDNIYVLIGDLQNQVLNNNRDLTVLLSRVNDLQTVIGTLSGNIDSINQSLALLQNDIVAMGDAWDVLTGDVIKGNPVASTAAAVAEIVNMRSQITTNKTNILDVENRVTFIENKLDNDETTISANIDPFVDLEPVDDTGEATSYSVTSNGQITLPISGNIGAGSNIFTETFSIAPTHISPTLGTWVTDSGFYYNDSAETGLSLAINERMAEVAMSAEISVAEGECGLVVKTDGTLDNYTSFTVLDTDIFLTCVVNGQLVYRYQLPILPSGDTITLELFVGANKILAKAKEGETVLNSFNIADSINTPLDKIGLFASGGATSKFSNFALNYFDASYFSTGTVYTKPLRATSPISRYTITASVAGSADPADYGVNPAELDDSFDGDTIDSSIYELGTSTYSSALPELAIKNVLEMSDFFTISGTGYDFLNRFSTAGHSMFIVTDSNTYNANNPVNITFKGTSLSLHAGDWNNKTSNISLNVKVDGVDLGDKTFVPDGYSEVVSGLTDGYHTVVLTVPASVSRCTIYRAALDVNDKVLSLGRYGESVGGTVLVKTPLTFPGSLEITMQICNNYQFTEFVTLYHDLAKTKKCIEFRIEKGRAWGYTYDSNGESATQFVLGTWNFEASGSNRGAITPSEVTLRLNSDASNAVDAVLLDVNNQPLTSTLNLPLSGSTTYVHLSSVNSTQLMRVFINDDQIISGDPTSIRFDVSLDDGATWMTDVPLNVTQNVLATTNQLRVKLLLATSNASASPRVSNIVITTSKLVGSEIVTEIKDKLNEVIAQLNASSSTTSGEDLGTWTDIDPLD